MKISRMISTVAASLVLTLTLSGVAYAESDGDRSVPADKGNINELIVELVEKNPGASYVDMEQAVKDAALKTGLSETEIAREALEEVENQPLSAEFQARSG